MWGRAIGAVFYVPAAVFWSLGHLRGNMKQRVVLMGTLLAGQVETFFSLLALLLRAECSSMELSTVVLL